MTIALLVILLCFAILDILYKKIPNILVLPLIIIGIYFIHSNFVPALIMLAIGASLFGYINQCPHCKTELICPKCGYVERHITPLSFWRAGDIKMVTCIGAFIGFMAIPVFLISLILNKIFRRITRNNEPLAYAPFLFVSTVITQGTIGLLQLCGMKTP